MDCIFCKIIAGEIPSDKLYEDDEIIAFRDLYPQAPEHFLIVPKAHMVSADCITPQNCAVIGKIFAVAAKLARELDLDNGYRIVNNCGSDGGQTVFHIHFHVLGGKQLGWPPFPG